MPGLTLPLRQVLPSPLHLIRTVGAAIARPPALHGAALRTCNARPYTFSACYDSKNIRPIGRMFFAYFPQNFPLLPEKPRLLMVVPPPPLSSFC